MGRLPINTAYALRNHESRSGELIRPRGPDAARRSRLGARGWIAGAALVVALGTAGSMVAAHAVARGDAQRSQRALAATSAEVAARLRLAIAHEQDLVVSTSAF